MIEGETEHVRTDQTIPEDLKAAFLRGTAGSGETSPDELREQQGSPISRGSDPQGKGIRDQQVGGQNVQAQSAGEGREAPSGHSASICGTHSSTLQIILPVYFTFNPTIELTQLTNDRLFEQRFILKFSFQGF